MNTADLEAEWATAQAALSKADALELLAHGIPKGVIMHMVGIAQMRLCGWNDSGRTYEPSDGGLWAYISPARVPYECGQGLGAVTDGRLTGLDLALGNVSVAPHTPWTDWRYPWAVLAGDLIDLICWDPATPYARASRCGAAEWLGCASRNEPTPIRRSLMDWLRHRCSGLVLFTHDRIRRYEILQECNDIVAEDDQHADELDAALTYPYPRKPVFMQ